jgi:hypothetical protein
MSDESRNDTGLLNPGRKQTISAICGSLPNKTAGEGEVCALCTDGGVRRLCFGC